MNTLRTVVFEAARREDAMTEYLNFRREHEVVRMTESAEKVRRRGVRPYVVHRITVTYKKKRLQHKVLFTEEEE